MIATKVFVFLSLLLAIAVATPQVPGGVSSVENLKEVEDELNKSLTKLAAGDEGPHYKVGKVYTASRQVVEGIRTTMVADLVDKDGKTKNCNVVIWSRPWLPNGIKVTFKCGEEAELVRTHSA
ncbi:sarcocystatin-A-like [Haematobia irritans]|uniref:sarcocystatin-A-like n=1 Tax=Haematobia irritans TaxID=7368 RepID=UPI003F50A43E